MRLDAYTFAINREKLALTQKRVKQILVCVINSYEKIIAEGTVFDFNDRGTLKHEDFLRNRLVDDYLNNELSFIDIGTEYFTVNKEVSEEYTSLVDNKSHPDPIDIHIVDKGLKNSWGRNTKPYFAIECKRLGSISKYVNDTKKMTERNYKMLRLPFEGQLGFVENPKWDYLTVKNKINDELSRNSQIETLKYLRSVALKDDFKGSFLSEHKKKDETQFSIFHILLNYSEIILN